VNGCVADGNICARAGSQLLRRGKLRRWVSASKLPSAGICATYTMLKDCNGAGWEIYNGIAGRGECLQQIQIMKKLLLAGIEASNIIRISSAILEPPMLCLDWCIYGSRLTGQLDGQTGALFLSRDGPFVGPRSGPGACAPLFIDAPMVFLLAILVDLDR